MNKEYRKRIRAALDYISRNADQDLTLDVIAEKANFSKYHFHRIFKAVTGETVYAHIRRLRLENAANRILADSGGVNNHNSVQLRLWQFTEFCHRI